LAKQRAKKIPRRHDELFAGIANFQALLAAARRAVKGKRKKPGAASFFANLEGAILALERQLRTGEYRPGRYVAFEVNDPKRRIVSAAPFRDRVVHHVLCAVVEPIFEAGFIDHSFANLFANVYLDGFDHFVTEVLRAPYVRYVDDFALFHNDPAILAEWCLRIELYLAGRRLKLHPRKTMILSCTEPSHRA
jgi:hypothetical protein